MADRTGDRESSNLSATIVATLKERILHWQYPPEHRLTEAELCKNFDVSRSPVREALRILATDGFVKKMPNRGYAVKQYNLREIEELYEVRLALELFVVESLANRGSSKNDDIDALKRTWTSLLNGSSKKDEELARLDTQFHETLAHAVGNKSLLRQLRAINERLMLFRVIDFGKAHRAESTCRQHLDILRCIAARDVPGARKAMQRNIEEGQDNVHTAIKDALARAYSL
ncbi:MAG TPA: GntR family transcriptional regulator [Nitrospira sp.]|jgi:DNA-binding GntR family transcriptional regulator|nr:GntR family transcriptional regulator [Nitrospira sp.]